METIRKKNKLSSTERLERRLAEAIGFRDIKKVSTFLDRLHRTGVHEGPAVDAAREFLRNRRGRR
ncbi:hypothetical protein AMJ47_00080 [Parcubacteria bacterium DG_72]|nr:MAG: hypothetical protein AMJ47_00080 [Parcubacteria bacterium DG_72]